MFITAKTMTGREYAYNNATAILCKSRAQAEQLAKHLNENNNGTRGVFKLANNEKYFVYEIDEYSKQPQYRLKRTRNCTKVAYNY